MILAVVCAALLTTLGFAVAWAVKMTNTTSRYALLHEKASQELQRAHALNAELKQLASDARADYAETRKLYEQLIEDVAEQFSKPASPATPDPLLLSDPMFMFREWIFTMHGPVFVDKQMAYSQLRTHMDVSLHQGSQFMVCPVRPHPENA